MPRGSSTPSAAISWPTAAIRCSPSATITPGTPASSGLGAAIGAFQSLGNHVYRRDFSSGAVIVNASEGSTVTIQLGEPYLDENSHGVNSVTLGPQRASILRKHSPGARRARHRALP